MSFYERLHLGPDLDQLFRQLRSRLVFVAGEIEGANLVLDQRTVNAGTPMEITVLGNQVVVGMAGDVRQHIFVGNATLHDLGLALHGDAGRAQPLDDAMSRQVFIENEYHGQALFSRLWQRRASSTASSSRS